jgi:hypothetical protein
MQALRWTEPTDSSIGRSLRSCQSAFDEMRNPIVQALYPMYQPAYPMATLGSAIPRKRSYDQEGQPPPPRILPRPPRSTDSPIPSVTNGESFVIMRPAHQERSSEPPKKRGRPSKEAVERREKELAAKGEVYKPTKRKSKKAETPAGSAVPPVTVPESSAVSSPVPGTPLRQTLEPRDESSSGKRRRRKQRDDHQESGQSPISSFAPPEPAVGLSAQSPSDRLLARGGERETASDLNPNEPPTEA